MKSLSLPLFVITLCCSTTMPIHALRRATRASLQETIHNTAQTTYAALSDAITWTSQHWGKAKNALESIYTTTIDNIKNGLSNHPYATQTAQVRTGPDISAQEKEFLTKRSLITKIAIKKLFPELNLSDDEIPTIAFVASGGGFRAMIETAGSLAGAQDTGLLDTLSYMSGLSGSVWYINPLVASGLQPSPYIELLAQNLQRAPLGHTVPGGVRVPTPGELFDIARAMVVKKAYGQSLNILNIYGFLVANELLSGMPNVKKIAGSKERYTMSNLQENLQKAEYPLPISTTLETKQTTNTKWFEFSPFEAGTYHTGVDAYVPIWALGRTFTNGVSTNTPPELSLGYIMGACCSAFAINCADIIHESVRMLNAILPSSVSESINRSLLKLDQAGTFKNYRDAMRDVETGRVNPHSLEKYQVIQQLTGGKIYNFTHNMSGQVMKNLHKLLLVDGGHDIIPLPYANDWGRVLFAALPLLRPARKVDLLIMADASDDILSNQTRSLGATAIRAKMDGLPFPDISAAQYKQAGYQTVSTFSSSDPNTPTVVYIPGILDSHAQSFSNVFNFRYTPEHIRYLTSITRKQFVDSMPAIKQAIYEAIMKKRATQKISLLKPS